MDSTKKGQRHLPAGNGPPITRSSSSTESQLTKTTDSQTATTSQTPATLTNTSHKATIVILRFETSESQKSPPPQQEVNEMDVENLLSESLDGINLSGILDKTIEGISDINETAEKMPTHIQDKQPELFEELIEESKRWRASLIILAKANHHKHFMETCLKNNNPPKSMQLWCKPYIYHSNSEVEKEWNHSLKQASITLVRTLIKHYSTLIKKEKETMETIQREIKTLIQTKAHDRYKHDLITQWNHATRQATEEAKALSDTLRATRERKLAPPRKRRRSTSEDEHIPKKHSCTEDEPLTAFARILQQHQKCERAPQQTDGQGRYLDRSPSTDHRSERGKEPDRGRNYSRKY